MAAESVALHLLADLLHLVCEPADHGRRESVVDICAEVSLKLAWVSGGGTMNALRQRSDETQTKRVLQQSASRAGGDEVPAFQKVLSRQISRSSSSASCVSRSSSTTTSPRWYFTSAVVKRSAADTAAVGATSQRMFGGEGGSTAMRGSRVGLPGGGGGDGSSRSTGSLLSCGTATGSVHNVMSPARADEAHKK